MARNVIGKLSPEDARALADIDTARKAVDESLKTAMEIHSKAVGGLIGMLNAVWNAARVRSGLPDQFPPNFQVDYATGELFVEVAEPADDAPLPGEVAAGKPEPVN
jgi:hypothetical protein